GRLDLPASAGMALTGLAIAAVGFVWWKHGRGSDRLTLAAAVVIALIASPIVWLHYLALLLVPVALTRRSLDWVWLLPLLAFDLPGKGSGGLPQTAPGPGIFAAIAFLTLRRQPEAFVPEGKPAAEPA